MLCIKIFIHQSYRRLINKFQSNSRDSCCLKFNYLNNLCCAKQDLIIHISKHKIMLQLSIKKKILKVKTYVKVQTDVDFLIVIYFSLLFLAFIIKTKIKNIFLCRLKLLFFLITSDLRMLHFFYCTLHYKQIASILCNVRHYNFNCIN